MTAATLDRTMPKPKRNDVPVKMDAEVVRQAKMVAASRDQTLAEYISETLRPIVKRALERILVDFQKPEKD